MGGLCNYSPKHPLGVAAGERGDGRGIEAVDGGDVAERIVLGHVVGIVGAHDDVVGAEHAHQLGELVRA